MILQKEIYEHTFVDSSILYNIDQKLFKLLPLCDTSLQVNLVQVQQQLSATSNRKEDV